MTDRDREPLLISGVVLDAPDAHALGAFYQAFLGWEVQHEDEGWMKLRSPHGGAGLAFQSDPDFVRPVWPGAARTRGRSRVSGRPTGRCHRPGPPAIRR